jgi:hypothetical protein
LIFNLLPFCAGFRSQGPNASHPSCNFDCYCKETDFNVCCVLAKQTPNNEQKTGFTQQHGFVHPVNKM